MTDTVLWQRIEGGLVFVAGLVLFLSAPAGLSWWLALLLFFAPDLSFLGYLLGPKVGAVFYNTLHIYALGGLLLALGLMPGLPLAWALGGLWLAHSGFDRMLGYGLKSGEGFGVTHLGRIGRGA